MSWSNPFRRKDENTREKWGYSFQWTPGHSTAEDLHPMKFTYDTLGEECLNRLDAISSPATTELPRNSSRKPGTEKLESFPPKRDLYALLRDHAHEDEKLGELWKEVNTTPEWVDWEQIARGQEVFYRYGGVAFTALAYHSLLGGMAAARVTEVLARTGGFSPKVARARMYETTQHILSVTSSLTSIQPGGDGHISSIRVRLLHAAVRRRILALAKTKPAYYSVEEYGIPINDLDSMATITTFSSALIWIGFPRQGIWLREREIEDYLAMWRLVAYYVGTPTDVFESPLRARCFMESLILSEIQPSEMSKVLANNIILSLHNQPPNYPSKDFLNASTRWLNGDELSDALAIRKPSLYYKTLVAGQCIFFMCLCYTYRSIPYLDRRKIQTLRTILPKIINSPTIGIGEITQFEFKYIPDFSNIPSVPRSTSSETKSESECASLPLDIDEKTEKRIESSSNSSSVERRNMRIVLLAALGLGVLGWGAGRGVLSVLGLVRGWVRV